MLSRTIRMPAAPLSQIYNGRLTLHPAKSPTYSVPVSRKGCLKTPAISNPLADEKGIAQDFKPRSTRRTRKNRLRPAAIALSIFPSILDTWTISRAVSNFTNFPKGDRARTCFRLSVPLTFRRANDMITGSDRSSTTLRFPRPAPTRSAIS